MIEQKEVIAFFDTLAPRWDAELIRSDEKIGRILDNAHVAAGSRVLDVACGTGVLITDYLARKVESVTAVDISPEMIRIAESKFPQENVRLICGDVEAAELGRDYDAIVVYNAFPHFPDGARLIRRLASLLREGGTLTVAHGMSRAAIDSHHHGTASRVSNGLMPVTALADLFSEVLTVTAIISDETMYQVAGKKVEAPAVRPSESASGGGFPAKALLAYTIQHNSSHLSELEELASRTDGEARAELLAAAGLMKQQNAHLRRALELLR